MTHAALKDQKARAVVWTNNCTCHPETCCCPPFKVKVDGKYLIAGTEEACATVAAAINAAALSAVEGEAAEDVTALIENTAANHGSMMEAGPSDGWFFTSEALHIFARELMRDTAPPPQQAADRSALLALADRMDASAVKAHMSGDIPNYGNTLASFAFELRALATQPQQAGGDDLRLADELDEWARQYQLDGGYANPTLVNAARTIRRLSTPPQPEAGGGEAKPVKNPRHPIQPLVIAEDGLLRFKKNAIVRYLLDNGGIDMNALAVLDFSRADREQFAQLIGYSHRGAESLGYISNYTWETALKRYERRAAALSTTSASGDEHG